MPSNGRDGSARGNIILAMLPVAILLALVTAAGWWLHGHRWQRDRLWWLAWTVPLLGLAGIAVLVAGDIYLQKVCARLLLPTALIWLCLLLTWLALALNRQVKSAIAVGLITLLYSAAGSVWLGAALLRGLEAGLPPLDPTTVERFDAICVLGGGTDVDPFGQPQLSRSGDRVVAGARWYLAGKTPLLVTSGSGLPGDTRDLAAETATIWRGLGIPEAAIVHVPGPQITREEITALQTLAQERGWQRVGLVTSAWHMPRALSHCQRLGFSVVPLACNRLSAAPLPWFISAIPHHEGFEMTYLALWEWLGTLVGR